MRNSSLLVFALLLLLNLSAQNSFADKPYAPLLEEPAAEDHDLSMVAGILGIRATKLPTKKEVGIPAYPGAKITSTKERTGKITQSITLLSLEPQKDITAFYKTVLQGWTSEKLNESDFFWKKNREASMLGTAPSVMITPTTQRMQRMMPGAKSIIVVHYEPLAKEDIAKK